MKTSVTRRQFLGATSLAGAGLALGATPALARAAGNDAPAKLGGKPTCRGVFPGWPVYDQAEEKGLLETLHSNAWYRGNGKAVEAFETAYEKMTGARHCLATASGTAALYTALGALDLGPGDEVIIPPYTFVATYNVVTLSYALPIFADIDLQTFQVNPADMAGKITPATKALLPVHIGGYPADLDGLIALGKKHNLPVIEDACQAHLAEWRDKKVGTLGLAGCFSFQASKNLNSGEGGAVLTEDDQFAETCFNFHNQGRARQVSGYNFTYSGTRGSNLRLSEFQGKLLVTQMTRVVEQSRKRQENALYLDKLLKQIPGITPAQLYPGATRSAYHLYMFRYDAAAFGGLSRAKFMSALSAEGVPCSSGYGVMNKDEYVTALAKNKHYLKVYGEKRMDDWRQQTTETCPENEKLCGQAVWFTQNMMLAERSAMDQIAEAVGKIHKHSGALAKA